MVEEVKVKIGAEIDEETFARAKARLQAELEFNQSASKFASENDIPENQSRRVLKQAIKEQEIATKAFNRTQELNLQAYQRRIIKEDQLDRQRELIKQSRIASARENITEQSAGMFGGYRGLRAIRMFDNAKEAAQNAGTSVIGELVSSAGPIALLSASMFSLVKVFQAMRQYGTEASRALHELGGAKNLHGQIVQWAENENTAGRVAAISTFSPARVSEMMSDVRNNYGIPPEAVNELFGIYAKASGGKLTGMPLNTIAKAVQATGDVEGVANFSGKLKNDYPTMSEGALSNLIAQAFAAQKEGVDTFQDANILDRLRPGGLGLGRQLSLFSAVKRGTGANNKMAETELLKYEQSHNYDISGMAQEAAGTTNIKTAPGAIHEAARQAGFEENVSGIKKFLESIDDSSAAVQILNKAFDNTTTSQTTLTLATNQAAETTAAQVKPALDEMNKAILENSTALATAKGTLERWGIELETIIINMEGWVAKKFNKIEVNKDVDLIANDKELLKNPLVGDADYNKEKDEAIQRLAAQGLDEFGNKLAPEASPATTPIQKSTDKDPTVEHSKATAANTLDMKMLLQKQNELLSQLLRPQAPQRTQTN